MNKFNLNLEGSASVVKDPVSLSNIKMDVTSGIKNYTDSKVSKEAPHLIMDKIEVNETLFI